MNVLVNGEQRTVPPDATVATVVAELHPDRPARGVAVAVDGEVVRRADWEALTLAEGARVEVLAAIGGGR